MVLICFYRAAYIGSLGALLALNNVLLAGPLANLAMRKGAAYFKQAAPRATQILKHAGGSALTTSNSSQFDPLFVEVPCMLDSSSPFNLLPIVGGCCSIAAAGCFIGSLFYLSRDKVKSAYCASAGAALVLGALGSYLVYKN